MLNHNLCLPYPWFPISFRVRATVLTRPTRPYEALYDLFQRNQCPNSYENEAKINANIIPYHSSCILFTPTTLASTGLCTCHSDICSNITSLERPSETTLSEVAFLPRISLHLPYLVSSAALVTTWHVIYLWKRVFFVLTKGRTCFVLG